MDVTMDLKPYVIRQPTATVMSIGPNEAQQILESSERNRSIRKVHVERYARDMETGAWQVAQPIMISDTGKLVDGHHRLHAVIKSGVTVDMLVVHGVEASVMNVLDTGTARTPGDTLKIAAGLSNPNTIATAVRVAIGLEQRVLHDKWALGRVTRTMLVARYQQAPEQFKDADVIARQIDYRLKLSQGCIAGVLVVRPQAIKVLQLAADAIGLDEGHPSLALLRWCQSKAPNLELATRVSVILRASFALEQERPLKLLRGWYSGPGAYPYEP